MRLWMIQRISTGFMVSARAGVVSEYSSHATSFAILRFLAPRRTAANDMPLDGAAERKAHGGIKTVPTLEAVLPLERARIRFPCDLYYDKLRGESYTHKKNQAVLRLACRDIA
jgi:hypothetical protein